MCPLHPHSTEYPNPTHEQMRGAPFINQIHRLLEKLTTGPLEEYPEETIVSPAKQKKQKEKKTSSFVDMSTTTTITKHTSLRDRIQSLEEQLDKLLTKPLCASTLQQNKAPSLPTVAQSQVLLSRQEQLEDTRFVVEVECAVPESFNPLQL